MIRAENHGPVTRYVMGRSFFGRMYYFTIAYHVDGLMLDTGCAYTADELVDALLREGKDVHTIVNTHTHEDHVSGNAAIQRRFGAQILCHPLGIPRLARTPRQQRLHPYRKLLWGAYEPTVAAALGESVETDSFRFSVIETPGHSRDHVCLYEPQRKWLFTGDLYVGGTDRAIRAGYDIWQIIESLREIRKLDVDVLFPGAARVRTDFAAEIDRKLAHYEAMGRQVAKLQKQGFSTGQIRRRLVGREGFITYFTLGHFSGYQLVRSYLRGD